MKFRFVHALALFLVIAASGEPFDFMIAPTRQDPSLDWWYAVPEGFTPQINLVSSVAKGEYFNIIPFFKNYGTTSNGQAHITYDIEILRPDGSTDESMQQCDGHKGDATPSNLLAARAVMRLCFDPEDPFGDYTINITAYDHVSNQTNRQSVTIEQKEFEIKTLSEEESEELFFRYATAPDPSLALAAFLQTEHAFLDEDREPLWSAIWFFSMKIESRSGRLSGFLKPSLKTTNSSCRTCSMHFPTEPQNSKRILFCCSR